LLIISFLSILYWAVLEVKGNANNLKNIKD